MNVMVPCRPVLNMAVGRLKEPITLSPNTGVSGVSFTGIYKPEQLSVLCRVLNDHCARSGIDPDPSNPDYEDASYLIMTLSRTGASTVEELKAALEGRTAAPRSTIDRLYK
jgi:hypothetical protein